MTNNRSKIRLILEKKIIYTFEIYSSSKYLFLLLNVMPPQYLLYFCALFSSLSKQKYNLHENKIRFIFPDRYKYNTLAYDC